MAKFAHLADVHLGGWKQQQMQELNFQSFREAINVCIKEKVDFVIIAGDLFDSAYPSIEILKKAFAEFRRLYESKIPCFLVAGSHDYSVSGKTFLDVLEKAGFCKNLLMLEENERGIFLNPIIYKGIAIYGYPGKKSSLEIENLKKIKLNDSPGMFKIFVLHTTIDKAKGSLPIDSISVSELPSADYYALGHLHIDFQYENFVYPGPVFPNNFQELEDVQFGGMYIFDTSSKSMKKIELKLKEVVPVTIELNNALTATEKIISEIDKHNIEDKIVLLRVRGELENGKNSDIKFSKIDEFIKRKNAYFFLRNTHELIEKEPDMEIEIDKSNSENIENETIKAYSWQNPSDFNAVIPQLIDSLSIEKQEDEKNEIFSNRLMDGLKKILKI